MTQTTTKAMRAAIELAANGYAVFPCRPDKAPATPRGFKDAVRDPAGVPNIWRLYSGPLIGVATGEVSGLAVLDIDHQHQGGDWWQANRARLPQTRTHRTRSGGLHLLFLHRDGLRCSASRIAPGIDVRSAGGYIIFWPAAGLPVLREGPLAEWPEWLAEAAMPARPAAAVETSEPEIKNLSAYASAALARATARMAAAGPGTRNKTLFDESLGLGRLAARGALDAQTAATALARAALAAGLPETEVKRTLASGLRAGGLS